MDLNFNCPGCNQELSVDESMVGTQVGCPSCGEVITVPAPATAPEPAAAEVEETPAAVPTSAPVRRDRRVSMPTRPVIAHIEKPNAPLAVAAARDSAKKLKFKTYRHADYVKDGQDRFDEVLTQLVEFTGQEGIVAMHPIQYTLPGKDGGPTTTDYGVIVVYKG